MKALKEKMYNFYQTQIKKHKDCPVCKGMDSMLADNKSKMWRCKNCGYSITFEKLENGYIYWFCDECEAFLNVQPGFEYASEKWICQECGFENDITEDHICGQCKDCGKFIPGDFEATLCDECRQIRDARKEENLKKAKEIAVKLGKSILAKALAIVMSAAKKAVQTYLANLSNGGIFDKESHMAAVASAKVSAISQMSDEMQGCINSSFGNIEDWLTQKIDDAIKQITYPQ